MARAMSQETWKLRGDLSRTGARNTVAQTVFTLRRSSTWSVFALSPEP